MQNGDDKCFQSLENPPSDGFQFRHKHTETSSLISTAVVHASRHAQNQQGYKEEKGEKPVKSGNTRRQTRRHT